jgi:putative CocE/NonD family hydrolase
MTPRPGSALAFDVAVDKDVLVAMRDGVRLAADLYRPADGDRPLPGPFPALLERTPYDKGRAVQRQSGRYFASRGYVVVMQDVRGRFASEGEWYFLGDFEGPDGFDTVGWMAAQPWCDGQVGTMGLSYGTATQQALAVLKPPALKAQFLLDGGYSYFHRTLRHGGACELGVVLPYACRMALTSRELRADPLLRRRFEQAWDDADAWLGHLPLRPGLSPLSIVPSVERWFFDLLCRSEYTDEWKHATVNLAEHVHLYKDVPVFLQTSWYGHHAWATATKYGELRARQESPKRLLIGPWLHGYDEFARPFAGEVDFGPESVLDNLNDLRLRWFDQWLKGLPTGVLDEAPVRLFVMGGGGGRRNADSRLEHGGRWRAEQEWPLARTRWTTLHLQPGGVLEPGRPPAGAPPSTYDFDPADPVPTIGGPLQNMALPRLLQGGGFDQRGRPDLFWVCRDRLPLSARPDVLVFQGAPLPEDLEVTGPITVRLFVSSSAVDTDFTAKLLDVYPPSADYPGGFALNLTDGIQRARYRSSWERADPLVPGTIYEIVLELDPVSNLFAAGHRLRLDLSSSNFPRFDVNPNTGEPLGRSRGRQIARNAVHHDADHPSQVVLPVIPRS